jgi:hypothetical protein
VSPGHFAGTELGPVLVVLAVSGAVVASLVAAARPLAAALAAIAAAGLAAGWAGAPLGPVRFAAPVLAATGATSVLAGISMQAIARWVAEARVPFARASAAMVVLLELAIPVDEADRSFLRAQAVSGAAASDVWNDVVWGALPPRSVVIVTDSRLARRAAAARAQGALRGDIAVIAAVSSPAAVALPPAFTRRALASGGAFVPLWRDLELLGAPTEASLSSLASERPVAMAYEPRWGRALGRHLVPLELLDRFQPEPRGPSDRRRALDTFAGERARLALAVSGRRPAGGRGASPRDADLAEAAAYLLRARVLDVAAGGDRDLIGRAIDDLHAFAPDDPVAAEIVARMAATRGAPKTEDLRP